MIKLISPFRGEFGIKLMRHVPAVHAMDGPKVVVCEPGEELLYPSADEHIICERAHDDDRRDLISKDKGIDVVESKALNDAKIRWPDGDFQIFRTSESMPRAYFTPMSDWVPNKDIDVVICPRFRAYGAVKNWPHWNRLAWLLGNATDRNYPVAIGAYESSDLSVKFADWAVDMRYDYTRSEALEAAVGCLKRAKLCIATDAGLAHLAMWCGCPLLMITYGPDCRVAPGAVRLGDGTIAHEQYWPVKIDRYRAQNHLGVDLMMVPNAWHDPELVANVALTYLENGTSAPIPITLCN